MCAAVAGRLTRNDLAKATMPHPGTAKGWPEAAPKVSDAIAWPAVMRTTVCLFQDAVEEPFELYGRRHGLAEKQFEAPRMLVHAGTAARGRREAAAWGRLNAESEKIARSRRQPARGSPSGAVGVGRGYVMPGRSEHCREAGGAGPRCSSLRGWQPGVQGDTPPDSPRELPLPRGGRRIWRAP